MFLFIKQYYFKCIYYYFAKQKDIKDNNSSNKNCHTLFKFSNLQWKT